MNGISSDRVALARCWLPVLASLLVGATSLAATQTLIDSGQRAFDQGSFNQAASDWQQALESFHDERNTNAEVQTSISLASAYQAIGQQRRAVQVLEHALSQATLSGNQSQIILVKSRLGAALILTLEAARAEALLREALAAAQATANTNLAAAILNDQGNLLMTQLHFAEALTHYEASSGLARQMGNSGPTAQSLCNAAAAAAKLGEDKKAGELNSQALAIISSLVDSHAKAFLLLNVGQTDRAIKSSDTEETRRLMLRAQSSFREALELSEKLNDHAIETYALGYLGQLYEQDGQLDSALSLTRRAVFAAQQAHAPEALYRWEWQSGRLLKKQNDPAAAVVAYRSAVQTLQSIRSDVSLGYGNSAQPLSFRESEGPLFYELADILLQQAGAAKEPPQEQALLSEARDVVENLKNVELQDYFCDECVDLQRGKMRAVETIDPHSAVIYLITLPDRTEILVGLTSGLKRFTVNVGAAALTGEVRDFRRNLETRTSFGYLEQAQHLYDWLIRPIRGLLAENQIDTLVFVPDAALRTIPFASLHDGEKFLIQDLAVAVVPGLSLVDPKPIERSKVHLLLSGISKPVQNFPPLNFVTGELHSIDLAYPSSEILLNEQFTETELGQKLNDEQFSVVHIASHGQFNRDVRKTFVLTYDGKLTLNDLEMLIRPSQYRGKPVELLVLSACQTAAGDDRAALGLAGVAIKAGARSALASLWFVNDQSTSALITAFYDQLRENPGISKARALQAAQVKLLSDRRYRHPCYWSPYLIIGNWL